MKKLGLRLAAPFASCSSPTRRTACAAATPIATATRRSSANHVLMLESDSGVFEPAGFGFTGPTARAGRSRRSRPCCARIGADPIGRSGGGADIGPSVQAGSIRDVARRRRGTTS